MRSGFQPPPDISVLGSISHSTCLFGDIKTSAPVSTQSTTSVASQPRAPVSIPATTSTSSSSTVDLTLPSASSALSTPPRKHKTTPYVYRDSPINYDKHYAHLPDDLAASLVPSDDDNSASAPPASTEAATSIPTVPPPIPRKKSKTKRKFKGHGWSKSESQLYTKTIRSPHTLPLAIPQQREPSVVHFECSLT